ncbi:uncharacterized protein LOC127717583 isoform X2 [Mytilus californianus]|uniref:uncharacterized protein LOC127717583 isoform X2 n=1 Tax=Mytilus californianus TaxID=6549 RepID=UPI00224746E9|nr:uncharacterized protein LOC127717583 isoform X2 [Mytilus californianus]
MDIIYMFVLFPVVSKSLLVLGRQENNELTERSSDQMPYDRNWLVIDKEQDYVHVGDKPEYSCSTKNDVQFLIGNPLRWEKVGRDGSRIKISTLANVEEGQLRKYNVLLYTNNTYMTFKLSFPQGITETDEGFLYCVQYDKNDIVLFERRVEVHVIAKTTTAAPTTTRAQITTSISNNICIDGHVMCTHLFPGECEVALHLMILCPASCDICYANGCNSTLVSSALSKNLVLSHSAGDYCSDGTRTNADSVILKLCNARTDKMWRQGIQVVSNCKQISLYAPVSSFGSFSHQLGIFLGCTDTGIKIGIQKCNDHFKEQALVSGDTSTAFSNADVYHVLIVK